MTTAGWIFMLCSLGFVVGVNIFCFGRVLFRPQKPDNAEVGADAPSREV